MEITFEQLFALRPQARIINTYSDLTTTEIIALSKRIDTMSPDEHKHYNKVRAIHAGTIDGYSIEKIAELLNIPRLEVAQNLDAGKLENWVPEWAMNQTPETLKIQEQIQTANNIADDKGSTEAETIVNQFMRLAYKLKASNQINELEYTHLEFETLLSRWALDNSDLITAFTKHIITSHNKVRFIL